MLSWHTLAGLIAHDADDTSDAHQRDTPARIDGMSPERSHRGILIANPRAGRGAGERGAGALARQIADLGFDVEVAITERPGHATDLARRAVGGGAGWVFALGGDGTVREAMAGILGTQAVLVPLPGGTTNVVAGALGLGQDPKRTVARLDQLAVRALDVGLCDGHPFLMQASAGLDASVMRSLRPQWKARLGKLEVAWSGAGTWWRYRFPEIRLVADGVETLARGAIVANMPFYAGQFRLIPEGRDDDGWLDLLLYNGTTRTAALSFAAALALGRHHRRRDVEIRRVREVRIEGPPDVALQVDGDVLLATPPITVALAPSRLNVLAAPLP